MLTGSLSKDDGYGNENVSQKYNLALSQVFRDAVLFTFYNTGELSCNWVDTNGFKVKTENNFFIVICSRCRQNLKFGDFTLLFCGVRQRNARKFVLHVQHVYFFFFNQSYSCSVALPNPHWSSLLQLPNREFKKPRRLRRRKPHFKIEV